LFFFVNNQRVKKRRFFHVQLDQKFNPKRSSSNSNKDKNVFRKWLLHIVVLPAVCRRRWPGLALGLGPGPSNYRSTLPCESIVKKNI
jgi:hypothetical protein